MASLLITRTYRSQIAAARARFRGKSPVLASPYGDVEYTAGSAGMDVLVIHSSGGGYDQGELMVRGLLGDGFRWIAPSRAGLRPCSSPCSTPSARLRSASCSASLDIVSRRR